MKKITALIIILCTLLFLTACNQDAKKQDPLSKSSDNPFFEAVNEDSILFVDRLFYGLSSYDTKLFQLNKRTDIDNFFIYSNNPMYNYFTAGYNIDYGFSIISLKDRKVNIEFTMPPNDFIVPIAFSDEYLLFAKAHYYVPEGSIDGYEESTDRYIARYDPATKTLTEYKNLTETITGAAIMGDTLYYSVHTGYNLYAVYKADCSDYDTVPVLVHENLKWPDVFTQGNNLYLSDRESIFCGEKRFSLGYENYFIGDKYLLQYISAFDGRREARIIDTETEKIVKRAPDILGVTAIGDEIIMYCEGSIERFKYR